VESCTGKTVFVRDLCNIIKDCSVSKNSPAFSQYVFLRLVLSIWYITTAMIVTKTAYNNIECMPLIGQGPAIFICIRDEKLTLNCKHLDLAD
jgi:hypothetical protein